MSESIEPVRYLGKYDLGRVYDFQMKLDEEDRSILCAGIEELGLWKCATVGTTEATVEELVNGMVEDLEWAITFYTSHEDSALTQDAVELKRKLQAISIRRG